MKNTVGIIKIKMLIKELKGVGPKLTHLFMSAGINKVNDLFKLKPKYQNYKLVDLDIKNNLEIVTIEGVISSKIKSFNRNKLNIVEFSIINNNKEINVITFNRPYLTKSLKENQKVTINGKYDYYYNKITANKIFTSKDIDEITSDYQVTGVQSYIIRNLIKYALEHHSNLIKENLPNNFLNKFDLLDRKTAYKYLHEPKTKEDIINAYRRFKFEEAYFNERLILRNLKNRPTRKPIDYKITVVKQFIDNIPFELTNDQKKQTNQIFTEFKTINPLSHIIVGDVGTGKTIVAFLAAIGINTAGGQTAFMAPTEILANQHYISFKKLFPNIKVALLTSKVSAKERKNILTKIKEGEARVIFGTHSLVNDQVVFENLKLAVIDEQHKFGVRVRDLLKEKSRALDYLYLSATPIPRSLEMAYSGIINIMRIDDKPKGRKEVITKVINEDRIDEAIKLIKDNKKAGNKSFIVLPAIDTEKHKYTIEEFYPLISNKIKENIYVLHGRQTKEEQDDNLNNFIKNDGSILVSTSIIEVGIDVSEATFMLILGADYFGLSALHQLRGRIGRGNKQSLCVLVSTKEDSERLSMMSKIADGIELAEYDLQLRGPGSILGLEQSGFINYEYLNIINDQPIIQEVRQYLRNIWLK